MKKSLSPGVVILVIAIVVVIVGLVFYKGAGVRTNQDQIKQAIMNQSGQGSGTQAPIPNATKK